MSGSAHYNKLYAAVYSVLDESFHKLIFLGPLKGTRLTVFTENAAYATQLHYQLNGNIDQIKKITGLPIRDFDIKVDPRRVKSQPAVRKPEASKSGSDCLAVTAKSLGDAPVADALASLAKHVKKPGQKT